ncbi:MAG: hypothetical protein ABI547_03490 [Betaproteobacteria bacterium]
MRHALTSRGFALVLLCGLALLHATELVKNRGRTVMIKYEAVYVAGSGIRQYLPSSAEISDLVIAQINRVAADVAIDATASPHNVLVGVERESGGDRLYVDVLLHPGQKWEPAFVGLCEALAGEIQRRRAADDRRGAADSNTREPTPVCRQLEPDPAAQHPARPHEILFVRANPSRISSARITAVDWFSLLVLAGAIAVWLPRRSKPANAAGSKVF